MCQHKSRCLMLAQSSSQGSRKTKTNKTIWNKNLFDCYFHRMTKYVHVALHWRHNGCDGVSNHQPDDSLLSRLFRRRWKKASKLRVTGLCAGNSPVTGEFPHKGPVTRKMYPFDDVIMRIDVNNSNNTGALWWRHNQHDGVSNQRRLYCLFTRLFRRRSNKTSKLRVIGSCDGNPLVAGGFPSQRASNAENVFIWWRHHAS